mmetsp:Transcript_82857/g.221399  ORF Transcript_82857/g.221399 Transcript_82857/m.221399 type:complete len:126 (+) Transcript_82857:470-847(+)
MCKPMLCKSTGSLLLQGIGFRPLRRPAAVADRLVQDPERLDPGRGQVSGRAAGLLRNLHKAIPRRAMPRGQVSKVWVALGRARVLKKVSPHMHRTAVTKLLAGARLLPYRATLSQGDLQSCKARR